MGGLDRRLRKLEAGREGRVCPECGVAPGAPMEFAFVSRDELGEGPDEEQCLRCGWPKRFTFNIERANARGDTVGEELCDVRTH